MSSLEGLERLKNWQKAGKPLMLSSVNLKDRIEFFECSVAVTFVDASRLMLSSIESPYGVETLDLAGVDFASTQPSDLVLTLRDGSQCVLYEKVTKED